MEAPPSPMSSRPEKSWAFGPPKVMKNNFCSATTLNGSAALPFVISTGGVVGLRPAQGDENNFCSATTLNGSAVLPFVISTGAPKERSGEICGPAVLSWECFSTERSVGAAPAVSCATKGPNGPLRLERDRGRLLHL